MHVEVLLRCSSRGAVARSWDTYVCRRTLLTYTATLAAGRLQLQRASQQHPVEAACGEPAGSMQQPPAKAVPVLIYRYSSTGTQLY
eukprot:SAG25_NODE_1531_length_2834_cov_1.982450_3_plen_86_part_00